MSHRRRRRRPLTLALAAAGAGALMVGLTAGPAVAHVEPTPEEIPAGTATTVGLTFEHGCDDSPTTSVAIQLPAGLDDVSAVARTGWSVATADDVVTYTAGAGNELPADEEGVFELELTPAVDAVGQTLLLKTVQTCETGEIRWIEEWDGEGEEPEHPAPAVTVLAAGTTATTPADGDHGDEVAGDADGHAEAATTSTVAADRSDADDGGVAVVVLLLVAALGFGAVAIVRHRRSA